MACGSCRRCLRGKSHLCSHEGLLRRPDEKPRLSRVGKRVYQYFELSCYAEQMLVHEKAVVKITREIPLEQAALLGCSVVTGVGAAQNTAKVGPGDTVAVVGCGGIGLNAIQGARLPGPSASSPSIASGTSSRRITLDEINAGFDALCTGTIARSVIRMDGGA